MPDQRTEIQQECFAVLDEFMAALNAHNAAAMDATMHFPHFRVAGGQIKVYERAGSNPMDLFQKLMAEDDWRYSKWRVRNLVQFNDVKAHVALSYARYRSDNSVIGVYESLYVLTEINGKWGIQIRSSFES
jgi:hypothetical protein